jgi:amino acid transporter
MKFLRQSTGLLKEFGAFDAFSLNFSFIGPAAGLSYPLFVASTLPKASWVLSAILGSILVLPLLLNYYLLSLHIPRSAGDYVYVSRAMGGLAGTVLAMSLIMSFSMGFPVLAELEVIMVIIPGLQSIGVAFHNPLLINVANTISTNNVYLTLTTTLVIAISFLLSIKQKVYRNTFRFLTILQIIGIAIIIAGMTLFRSSYLPYVKPFHEQIGYIQTLALSSIFVLSMYAFSNAPSYFGGEIKKPKTGFFAGYILSYFAATLFVVLLILSIEFSIGKGGYIFATIQGWNLPISTSSLLAFGVVPFLNIPEIAIILVVSALSWYLLYAMINVTASSRMMLSLAFDRVLPSFLGDVKGGIPVNALITSFLLSALFEFIEVYLGYSVSFAVDGLWFIIWNYVIVSIASIKFSSVDKRILITSILSITSLISVVLITIFYSIITLGNFSFGSIIFSGNEYFDIITIFIPPLSGLLTYIVSKRIRKKEGIDISLTFKEIPPE